MSIYAETGDVIPGQGLHQSTPTFPQDQGFLSQSPIPPIPPMMIEAFAEPYHTGIITFIIDDGDLKCPNENAVSGVRLDTDLYFTILQHVIVQDEGTLLPKTLTSFHNPMTNHDDIMTLHGGEIRDDDTFHLLGILGIKSASVCGEYLVVVDIVGECDSSYIKITSRPPSLFNITASGDGFHAACIR